MREIWSQVFSKTTKAFQEWQKVCISKISFASQCFFLLNSRLQRADAKQKNAGTGSSNGDSHESLSDEDSKECGSQTTNYSSWIKNIRTIAEQKSHQKYTIKNWVSDFCFCKKNHQLQQNSSITYPEGLLLDSRRWILLSWFKKKGGDCFSPIEGLFVRQNLAGMFHRMFVSKKKQKETPTDLRWRIKKKHAKSSVFSPFRQKKSLSWPLWPKRHIFGQWPCEVTGGSTKPCSTVIVGNVWKVAMNKDLDLDCAFFSLNQPGNPLCIGELVNIWPQIFVLKEMAPKWTSEYSNYDFSESLHESAMCFPVKLVAILWYNKYSTRFFKINHDPQNEKVKMHLSKWAV